MLEKLKRRPSARARRIVSITAGLALVASAVALPATTAAAAEPAAVPVFAADGKLPPIPKFDKRRAVPPSKKPPGAKKATSGPEKPGLGRNGPFQKPTDNHTNIVGGQTANAADFPSVVGIKSWFFEFDEDGEGGQWWYYTCTGSVLSPTRVLTAAHCTIDLSYGFIEVIAGRNVLSATGSGFVAQVSHTFIHQQYNAEATADAPINDISVLTLRQPLPADYTPVSLINQGAADPAGGTAATIVGYGITDESKNDSGTLRKAEVSVASDSTCASASQWPGDFNSERMVCAGTPPTTGVCNGDSGGPLFVGAADARVQVGVTSWGSTNCESKYGVFAALNFYSNVVKNQITLANANNLDWTGDGHSDLMGRLPDGTVVNASSTGLVTGGNLPTFNAYGLLEGDFSGYNKLFRVNNWSGDNQPSIFARDSAGRLYNYRGDGEGNFNGAAQLIGTGWNTFTDIMVTNDWIGNGLPNLMARTADGKLYLYNSNGSGGWSNPKGDLIGVGWNSFNTVLTPGSWRGDGRQSLIGRTPAGELRLYTSNGTGGWVNPKGDTIGVGWGSFSTFMSPGDLNGDNLVDLVGVVRSSGDLKLYATNGKGVWLNSKGVVIDQFWDDFNLVF